MVELQKTMETQFLLELPVGAHIFIHHFSRNINFQEITGQ